MGDMSVDVEFATVHEWREHFTRALQQLGLQNRPPAATTVECQRPSNKRGATPADCKDEVLRLSKIVVNDNADGFVAPTTIETRIRVQERTPPLPRSLPPFHLFLYDGPRSDACIFAMRFHDTSRGDQVNKSSDSGLEWGHAQAQQSHRQSPSQCADCTYLDDGHTSA